MRKFLATVFLAAALPAFADDFTRLEIHVLSPTGRGIDNASVVVKFAADLPKAQAAEAKAKAAGHTKLADRIAARITKAQNRETKVNARLAKLQAECGTGGTSAG